MIVDAQLPDGSGFDLADAIRGHAALSNTPVLTLIAADRSVVAQADRACVSACLMKPVKQSELFRAVLAGAGHRAGQRALAGRAKGGDQIDLPPLHILVGEDSLVNQKLVYEILTRRGHSVVLAGNGEDVLARA